MDKSNNKGCCPSCSKVFVKLKRNISKKIICQQFIHTKFQKTTAKLTKIVESGLPITN